MKKIVDEILKGGVCVPIFDNKILTGPSIGYLVMKNEAVTVLAEMAQTGKEMDSGLKFTLDERGCRLDCAYFARKIPFPDVDVKP